MLRRIFLALCLLAGSTAEAQTQTQTQGFDSSPWAALLKKHVQTLRGWHHKPDPSHFISAQAPWRQT